MKIATGHILVKNFTSPYGVRVMSTSLGAYIAERRKALGITQEELADRAGIKRATLAQIESGGTKLPLPETRRKLAAALGVRHVDLLVAAGELLPEEIADVAPLWPSDDPGRVRLFELVRQLPPTSLRWIADLLEVAAQAPQWQQPAIGPSAGQPPATQSETPVDLSGPAAADDPGGK